MVKELLVTLFYLTAFNLLIARYKQFQFKNFKPVISLALFNIKFITGVFIWVIYTFYYKDVQNNDVHKFYNDAVVLRNVANESPKDFVQIITGAGNKEPRFDKYYAKMKNWQRNFDEAPFNENQTVIKLNALLMFVTLRVYFAHVLFMCFISLIGWVLLTDAILKFALPNNAVFAIPVMLLPTVLFWTSGVMKEPLLVLGLGAFISGMLLLGSGKNMRAFLLMAMGAFIMLLIKFFVLLCLMPAVISYLVLKGNQNSKIIISKYLVIHALLLAGAFNVHKAFPQMDLQQMMVNKQMHSVKEAAYFNAGSRTDIPMLGNDALSVFETAPVGIWNTVNRPYLWEGKNVMMLASAAENVVIVLFILLFLSLSDFRNFKQLNLLLFLLSFSLVYFALIGICTPVLGNLVRYKAPVLPVFLFAFILAIKSDVVPVWLRRLMR